MASGASNVLKLHVFKHFSEQLRVEDDQKLYVYLVSDISLTHISTTEAATKGMHYPWLGIHRKIKNVTARPRCIYRADMEGTLQ
jgi:hypothetical protein